MSMSSMLRRFKTTENPERSKPVLRMIGPVCFLIEVKIRVIENKNMKNGENRCTLSLSFKGKEKNKMKQRVKEY